MSIRSQLSFNRQQQLGILSLLTLVISLLLIFYFIDVPRNEIIDTTSPEIVSLQKQIDSLREMELANRLPKNYPFNPNYLTDFKGYTLGMSTIEIDRLLKYRQEGKWINSVADFKNITQVSDSLLQEISPYFKFPDWVANSRNTQATFNEKRENKGFTSKTYAQKIDLNLATQEELQQVSGVGVVLSRRIVAYRGKLNGFVDDIEIFEVYGLDEEVGLRVLNLFTVKTPKQIVKMPIHSSSASDIATIPGITFDLAKSIWEYRVNHKKIHSFEELSKIEGLSRRKLGLIQLYLSLD